MSGEARVGLSGVRVVDFGHQIAGPLAALLLAEAGADVVHVDSPAAARAPGPADAYFNRSKRRITLDLKRDADRATARELIARADVVIENFRPGVMDRLGLGAGATCGANERLIYCSLPGFGPDDEKAQIAAREGVLHAAVAGYRPLSQHWDPTGRRNATVTDREAPLFTPITTASNFGGLMGAVAVVMALIARQRSGRGQRIQLPLAEAFAGVAGEWEAQGLINVAARTFALERRDTIMAAFADLVRGHPAAWWDEVATRAQMPVSRVRTPHEWLASEHAATARA